MNETIFRQKLFDWAIVPKDGFIPTTAEITLYGQKTKTKVISAEHEHLIYDNIKLLEVTDDLYKKLTEEMKLNDWQILKFIQKTYEQYLKDIRKNIMILQVSWSKNFAHFRAKMVMQHLMYDNIYQICDLVNQRIVPIELILKVVFNIQSNYGDHRRIKDKSEVFVDPRVLKMYNDIKEADQKHREYVEKWNLQKQQSAQTQQTINP